MISSCDHDDFIVIYERKRNNYSGGYNECPVCSMKSEKESLEENMEELKSENKDLQNEIKSLERNIADLEAGL